MTRTTARSCLVPTLGLTAAFLATTAAFGSGFTACLAAGRGAKEAVLITAGGTLAARLAATRATTAITVVVVQQPAALGAATFAVPRSTGHGKRQKCRNKEQKGTRQKGVGEQAGEA